MKVLSTALGLAVALSAMSASAHERAHTPTLGEVTSVPASETVQVSCRNPSWPTSGQVARYSRVEADAQVLALRRQILSSGRETCAQGFTHVRIEFLPSTHSVAVVPASAARLGD